MSSKIFNNMSKISSIRSNPIQSAKQPVNSKQKKSKSPSKSLKSLSPLMNEAQILITILDIKFGNRQINNPSVTTIYEEEKINVSIPFQKPLAYKYSKIEEEMIFKYALMGNGDLIGFIYLEIPHRFKAIKGFKIDDWFPIKKMEAEDDVLRQMQNFMARIQITYKAAKKFKVNDYFESRLDHKEGFNDIAGTLKRKMNKIHKDIDNFQGEGMNHLRNFERKLLKKQMNMRKWELRTSPFLDEQSPHQPTNVMKQQFYLNKEELKKSPQIKKYEIKNDDLLPFEDKKYKLQGYTNNNTSELFKELSHTKIELVKAQQKIAQYEDKHMTVDNKEMYKKLQLLQQQLNEEKEILIRKTQMQEVSNQKQIQQISEDYRKKNEDLEKERIELKQMKSHYTEELLKMQEEGEVLKVQQQRLFDFRESLKEEQNYIEDKRYEQVKEKEELDILNKELEEIKSRIMKERKEILKEEQQYSDRKQELISERLILDQEKELLKKERNQFEHEREKFTQKIEVKKMEIEQEESFLNLEKIQLKKNREELDEDMNQLIQEKSKLKSLETNLIIEKEELKNQKEEFLSWKKIVDQEYMKQKEELDTDFLYLQQELKQLELNRGEYEYMKNKLENYASFLGDQDRIHNLQRNKFYQIQNEFFKKIKGMKELGYDMKKYQAEILIQQNELENQRDNVNKIQQKIVQEKSNFDEKFRKISNAINMNNEEFRSRVETLQKKKTTRLSRFSMFSDIKGFQMELFIDIKQDAENIAESIFMNVCLKKIEKIEDKETYIKELQQMVLNQKQNNLPSLNSLSRKHNSIDNRVLNDLSFENKFSDFKVNKDIIKDAKKQAYQLIDVILEDGKNVQLPQNQIIFLHKCKTTLQTLYSALEEIISQKWNEQGNQMKGLDLIGTTSSDLIKQKYERKIRILIDYINKIKNNTDFFNYNVDNDILVTKQFPQFNKYQFLNLNHLQ